MPRDWKNHPAAVAVYCTCGKVPVAEMMRDGGSRTNYVPDPNKVDPDCKLHGDNPAHALPESI